MAPKPWPEESSACSLPTLGWASFGTRMQAMMRRDNLHANEASRFPCSRLPRPVVEQGPEATLDPKAGTVGAPFGAFISDPRVLYDASTGHLYVSAVEIDVDPKTGALLPTSRFMVAVSLDANPSTVSMCSRSILRVRAMPLRRMPARAGASGSCLVHPFALGHGHSDGCQRGESGLRCDQLAHAE